MQVRKTLTLRKTQVLPCVSFTPAGEQKATKEIRLAPFIAVGVNRLESCRKEKP